MVLTLLMVCGWTFAAESSSEEPANTGQNLFKPLKRFDIRQQLKQNSGDMFIPIDVMLGKMLNKSTVVSVEFATPLVNDYDLYDWLVEFRIGFFF
jgi:hypothetical protein